MKKIRTFHGCDYHVLLKTLRIMRITAFLLLVSILQAFASDAYSQKTRLTLQFTNTKLVDVLDQIEERSEFFFLYNEKLIDENREVSVSFNNQKIDKILDTLFEGTDVHYTITDRKIILAPSFLSEDAQQNPVSGTVTDEAGQPLPGVTVVVKGTTTGTVTNSDGNYSLTNIPEDATLVFSFVGMRTQEIVVGNQSNIYVTMVVDAIGIEEVVAVGYGTQKKVNLTGAVGSVKAEDLVQRPAANTTDLLQGQIAGLITRQSSGLPGDDGAILNIRGFGDPLIIVDGIESGMGQIDPNDIESISVLKDASAAVYGARAGNGVILVNTKRGSDRPSRISYHGSVSITQPTFLAKPVTANQWAELMTEVNLDPDNFSPNHVHYDRDSKRLINLVDNSDYKGYNWQKALYRDWTPQQQHNISADGGNEKIRYFVSVGFTDQESNFKSGDYDFNRYNIRSNIDANIAENLAVSVDFSYRKTLLDKANFDTDGMFTQINRAKPVFPYIHEQDPERATYAGTWGSPYFETFKDYSGFIENRDGTIQGAFELRYSYPKVEGLIAKARLNYEDIYSWDKTVNKPLILWEYDALAANNGDDPWIQAGGGGISSLSVSSNRANELIPQLSIEYENNFGNHHVKGQLVGEIRTYKFATLRGSRRNLLSLEAPYLNFASDEGKDNSETFTERARTSMIGRFNYDYLGKYMIEFAMRADASGEYPQVSRWGYFPSVSAGWRLSEEPFIKDNFGAINNLKLRGSYGILGYDAISSFDYLVGYEITGQSYIFGTSPKLLINSSGLANPDITWETSKITNIGIDATFWDGKLGFELDAFYRLREDLLGVPTTQVPSTFGASLPRVNLNKMDNRGIEITITHQNRIGGFTYDISPSFSWSRGKYKEWDEDSTPPASLTTEEDIELWKRRNLLEGHWDDEIWGYVSDGFFMNQAEIDNYSINQDQSNNITIKVGDLKYKDLNGDNYIDWRDETIIATGSRSSYNRASLPNIMYSMNMGVSYKSFSVRMLWQGAADYAVYVHDEARSPFSNESVPLDVHYKYRAIVGTEGSISNPNEFKLPPVVDGGSTANNSKQSDYWIYDARFLRLKNLYLSYLLPGKLMNGSGISQCRFYLSGTNLWTISNLGIWKKSFDPEVVDQLNRDYPPVKTITFGLKLTI